MLKFRLLFLFFSLSLFFFLLHVLNQFRSDDITDLKLSGEFSVRIWKCKQSGLTCRTAQKLGEI